MYVIRTLLSYSLVIVVVAAAVLFYQYRDRLIPEANAMYEDYRAMLVTAVEKLPTTKKPTEQPQDSPLSNEQEPATVVLDHVATDQDTESKAINPEPVAVAVLQEDNAMQTPTPKEEQLGETEDISTNAAIDEAPAENVSTNEEGIAEHTTNESPIDKEEPLDIPVMEPVTAEKPTTQEKEIVVSENETESVPIESTEVQDVPPAKTVSKEPVNDRTSGTPTVEFNLLARARNAFWRGQLDEAVSSYQELVNTNPADPNAYGELGNVYYAMGNWEKAGDAYYEAAKRLIKRNQTEQLEYLLRVLHGLNEEKAKKLMQQQNKG